MYQLFSCSIASWHEECATSSTAVQTSLSRFFSVFESMLGRFKAARNLITAASQIPENKIGIKNVKNNLHLHEIISIIVGFFFYRYITYKQLF